METVTGSWQQLVENESDLAATGARSGTKTALGSATATDYALWSLLGLRSAETTGSALGVA